MSKYVYINEEMKVYIYKEYYKTVKSFLSSGKSKITVNNLQNIQSYPQVTLSFKKTVTNPTFTFKNNGIETIVQISSSFVNGDKVSIDSMHKSIKKNNLLLNLTPTLFPVINSMSYFEIAIDNTVADITLIHKTYEDTPFYTKSREDFNLQANNKKIELNRRFYNSEMKESKLLDGIQTFDFSVPMYDDYFLSMINKNDTYRIVVDLENSDEYANMQLILCNCTLEQAISSSSNSIIHYKVNGSGKILGQTPSLSDLFSSDTKQLIITNNTKGLSYEISYLEQCSPKYSPKYIEKKIFRSKPKKILQELGINLDCVATFTDNRLMSWFGDDMDVSLTYYNIDGSIPIVINDVVIDSLNLSDEKDSFVKQNFTISGYL